MESGGIVVDEQRAENARAFNPNASIEVEYISRGGTWLQSGEVDRVRQSIQITDAAKLQIFKTKRSRALMSAG